MVADGADTIYDPEHWVVASYIDPRGHIGAVSNAGRVLIKTGGQIRDVATADALGALAGGIGNGVKGLIFGPGALVEAAKGAIATGIGASVKSALA